MRRFLSSTFLRMSGVTTALIIGSAARSFTPTQQRQSRLAACRSQPPPAEGQTSTIASSSETVTLAAGQTLARSLTFKVSKQMARGTYSFKVTAFDATGSVTSTATFKVT